MRQKAGGGTVANWFNTTCFAAPPQWGYGNEARVDSTLRAPGTNNFDFAIFKRVLFAERYGLEFGQSSSICSIILISVSQQPDWDHRDSVRSRPIMQTATHEKFSLH